MELEEVKSTARGCGYIAAVFGTLFAALAGVGFYSSLPPRIVQGRLGSGISYTFLTRPITSARPFGVQNEITFDDGIEVDDDYDTIRGKKEGLGSLSCHEIHQNTPEQRRVLIVSRSCRDANAEHWTRSGIATVASDTLRVNIVERVREVYAQQGIEATVEDHVHNHSH